MFKILFTVIALIWQVVAQEAQWNTEDFLKRHHSMVKPYLTSGLSIPYWDVHGFALASSNYVRLTADLQSRYGAIWNTVPVYMNNWEVQITLKIHGKGKELFGDGMAFWYVRDRMEGGPVFGNKDFFSGLGVIIDTYSNHNGEHNHNHPYLSAMVNNGSLHYDHDMDGTHTQLAGCECKLRNLNHDTHIAIRYEDENLTVSTDFENKAAWKECFKVSGVKLPTGYYFGVSAATGDLSDNHDVLGIRTYELEFPGEKRVVEDRSHIIPSAITFEPPRERVPDAKKGMSGVKMFFLILIGLVVLGALAVIGLLFYQKYQDNKRKRFY
ncbi:hypothetical protein M8J75_010880 [Diaphorina citri]|nr:hypothetical protein M8J75_010880 [Diaphorina citri]KAI5716036.1 hypothetical protein M8J77_026387 [Diaphorina citri]